MKHARKIFAFAVALVMALAVALPAFAQEVTKNPADADDASITIKNPAKGETYALHKLFDATVGDGDAIAYQGTIPDSLNAYFETIKGADGSTNYVKLKTSVDEKQLIAALGTWAESNSALISATSEEGDDLVFKGLPFGYYVMTTTHKDSETGKSAITVDSTQPNAVIYDKNETTITVDKTADGTSYSIGDTITYTATFGTTNFYGSGQTAGKITKYVIKDTLPEFLSDVAITGITIDGQKWNDAPAKFDNNKEISIPWVDASGNSLYANGAKIVVTYTAKLTSTVNVNAANTNTVSITPYGKPDGDDDEEPYSDPFEKDATITTYAAALAKTDGTKALAGAKFKVKGLSVEKTADGVYTVKSYNAADSAPLGDEMATDAQGKLYIVGLKEGNYTITETVAPDGYNKLTESKTIAAQVFKTEIFKESGTRYYDAKGNLVSEQSTSTSSKTVNKNLNELDAAALTVVNNKGTEMPSTGGIGTTIFYVVGGVMVAGAAIFLLTKRRMSAE